MATGTYSIVFLLSRPLSVSIVSVGVFMVRTVDAMAKSFGVLTMGEFNYNAVDRSSLYVLQSVTSCDFPWPPRLPPGTRHHRKEGGREGGETR